MFGIGLALSPSEHLDYEIIQSLNPEFNKAVIRVNQNWEHRQTIQVRLVPNPATWGQRPAVYKCSKMSPFIAVLCDV